MLFVLLACAGKAAEVPDNPPPPPPPPLEEGTRFVATWQSASCGERSFPRELVLNPDFTYSGTDYISPCPVDAQCIWSGIVTWNGTWSMEGPALKLTEQGEANDHGFPHPTELKHGRGMELAEVDGEALCPYTLAREPVGAWLSEACEERAYPRELDLREDGTYTGLDLVAPCPEDAHCEWSGVVVWSGTWTSSRTEVHLTETDFLDGGGAMNPERPETLDWMAGSLSDGACPYQGR